MFYEKNLKKMDGWDLGLVKLTVAAAVLFIITIWPGALNLVQSINPWYFLVAFVIFAARPVYRIYFKK